MATMGTESPLTEADLAAFAYTHPALDRTIERKLLDLAPNTYILEQLIAFETFHFSAEDTGDLIFDVRGIKDGLAAKQIPCRMFDTTLTEDWIEHIRKHGGVEEERMKSLTDFDLNRPQIAIFWPNGYTTIIDGNNRLVRRWDDGLRTTRIAVITLLDSNLDDYVCRPGDEDLFLARRAKTDPRRHRMTILNSRKL